MNCLLMSSLVLSSGYGTVQPSHADLGAAGLKVEVSRQDGVIQGCGQRDVVLLRGLQEEQGVLDVPRVKALLHQLVLLLLEGFCDVQRGLEAKTGPEHVNT